jgi:hypothetical protein
MTLQDFGNQLNSFGSTAANIIAATKTPAQAASVPQSADTKVSAAADARAKWLPFAIIGVLILGAVFLFKRK